MKKSFFAIALMASLLAGAAKADTDSYLFWMINVEEDGWEYNYSARVMGVDGSGSKTPLGLYDEDGYAIGSSVGKDLLQTYKGYTGDPGFYAKLASERTYTSYVFELFCDSGTVARSDPYTDVQAFIVTGGIDAPKLSPMLVSMTLPAPEPSSGLLLLLGVAGLALRRRKQITA